MSDGMIHPLAECEKMTDKELVCSIRFLADRSRHNELRLLAHLAEFDSRRLCLEEGFRSAYDYCTNTLGFDEQEAYRRIRVARVIRAYPDYFIALEARKVTASALVILAPWLQRDNAADWLKAVEGKPKRAVEALVAAKYPQAPQPDHVRNLPSQTTLVSSAPPLALETEVPGLPAAALDSSSPLVPIDGGPPQMTPIAADRVRVGFDAAAAVAQMIERMRQILRHKYPEGRLEDLIREALDEYLDRNDPQRKLERREAKSAAVAIICGSISDDKDRLPTRYLRACASGRYIPAKVKSQVWARDRGCCAWKNPDGKVCGAKDWIEYDHVTPYARGGRSDDPRNLRLVCRQHNQAAALAAGFSLGPPAS